MALTSTVPPALARSSAKRAPAGPQVARRSPPVVKVGKLKLLLPPLLLMLLKALQTTTAPPTLQEER